MSTSDLTVSWGSSAIVDTLALELGRGIAGDK